MQLVATRTLDDLKKAGTVIIPGWKDEPTNPVPVELTAALRAAHEAGVRIVSICTGAFVLAAAGLLDGKRATTHWRYAHVLQTMYPRIDVDPSVLYIDEGQVLTSAGSAAAIDLCLHVVRKDYGAQVANHIARRLVVQPHRDGGQAQFIERPVSTREKSRIAMVIETMQRRISEDISIPDLAALAAMSQRTFMRRFKEATGATPGDWLRISRLDRAQLLLETSQAPIEIIAAECGFGTATTLRQHFRKRLGISPTEYKRRFQHTLAS
jgi:AraC family transcriptional activator FtrA